MKKKETVKETRSKYTGNITII